MLYEYKTIVSLQNIDIIMETLSMYGFYNLYYDQPFDAIQYANGYDYQKRLNENVELKIVLEDAEDKTIEATRQHLADILNIELTAIDGQWLKEDKGWQQPFPVIDLSNGWFIKPTIADEELDGKVILFEPPRAFGSGLHGTTQDCLRFILNENLHAKKVLDIGTGSGLLAIAAASVGAEQVVAIDIENVETEVLYNAALNDVKERISVIEGDPMSPTFMLHNTFDWVFVNIGGDEDKALAPFIDHHLLENGKLILSGMVEWNHEDTLAVYQDKGFSVESITKSDEWVTSLLIKKPSL